MKNRNKYYKQYYKNHKKEIYAKLKKWREKQKYNKISFHGAESFDNESSNMEINIKSDYKIEIHLQASDLMKITGILLNTPYQKNETLAIGGGYYLLELNTIQLTYILNYFLKKEVE